MQLNGPMLHGDDICHVRTCQIFFAQCCRFSLFAGSGLSLFVFAFCLFVSEIFFACTKEVPCEKARSLSLSVAYMFSMHLVVLLSQLNLTLKEYHSFHDSFTKK